MTAPTRDAVAQARANVESWFDLVTPQTHKDLDALIAAVRAECAAKVRALPSVRYTDVLGNHIHTVINRDEVLAALEAQP